VRVYISAYVNPNVRIGGFGIIIENEFGDGLKRELSGSLCPVTPNRIRMLGIIEALDYLRLRGPRDITIYTDSEYIINGIRKKSWSRKWRSRNWLRSDGEEVKNADLWAEMLDLYEFHNIEFILIKERNGCEWGAEYNERCYELALEAIRRGR
jgi:ribonuclease HI